MANKNSSMIIVKQCGDIFPAEPIYRLFGNNETVLTNLLSYLLSVNSTFCFEVLRPFIDSRRTYVFNDVEICRQRNASGICSGGKTDIEIINRYNFHIIFEAKINNGIPSLQQCTRYVKRFKKSSRTETQKLVFLVNDKDEGQRKRNEYVKAVPELDGYLEVLDWGSIQNIILRLLVLGSLREEKDYFIDFWNFMKRSYYMKSFEQEVMIVGINDTFKYSSKVLSEISGKSSKEAVFRRRIYASNGAKIKTVLYLAFRCGKLSHFARVKEQKMRNGYMLFFLDKILELPVKRNVPYAYRQGIQHTTIQRLLDPDIEDFKGLIIK